MGCADKGLYDIPRPLPSPTADQVYGDQEMHSVARNLCMDYMVHIYMEWGGVGWRECVRLGWGCVF